MTTNLKTRVMPTLLCRDGELVKGEAFDSWRRIGSVMQAVRLYNAREVDELVYLDITATREGREPDYALVSEMARECFMPLTIGGGVRSVEHVARLLEVGADKVAIGTGAFEEPSLLSDAAARFGSQCAVVSIDHRGGKAFSWSGTWDAYCNPVEWAAECERRGAGEILLTSIERDGTMRGYDVDMICSVSQAVGIPVIASGGCGSPEHMDAALGAGASAVAAGAMFQFTQVTPLDAKRYLHAKGHRVRLPCG